MTPPGILSAGPGSAGHLGRPSAHALRCAQPLCHGSGYGPIHPGGPVGVNGVSQRLSCDHAVLEVVTWRRAQMVLLSAQGTDVAAIARVAFTSEDRSVM